MLQRPCGESSSGAEEPGETGSAALRCAAQGCNLVVGGGMGRTHRNEDTFPRLADPLGYVDKGDIFHVVSKAPQPALLHLRPCV